MLLPQIVILRGNFSDYVWLAWGTGGRRKLFPGVIETEASGDHQPALPLVDLWLFLELHSEGVLLIHSLGFSSA